MPNINAGHIHSIRLQEQGSDPGTPAATYWQFYVKSDGLYAIDSSGNVVGPLVEIGALVTQAAAGNHNHDAAYAAITHAGQHQNAGGDEVATATPAANSIPKTGAGTTLDKDWYPDFVGSGASHAKGAVPDPGAGAGTTKFLREDASWQVPAGAGDVVGPGSSTDNAITRFDQATGKLVQNSLATVDDSGGINIPTGQTYNINGSPHTHAGGSGHTIQDEGSNMTARTNLNFVGAGVTVTDDVGNNASVVTIPAGSLGSGQTLVEFHPYNNEPPAANYATLDTRNGHPTLDFDAATDESAVFTGIMPRSYAGGGVTVYLHITDTNDTNAAHKSYWDVSFERDTAQDLDADSFAAAQSGNISPNGTSGIPVVLAIAFTNGAQMDSVAAGELFRLMVTRDANNGSDDWANDAELLYVELKET